MKIDRLVSIVMVLLEKERIGAKELAKMFEVSPRTIYRDIDTINMSGIPVCSTSGAGGGFEIMQEYKVDKKLFSASDLSAILMGLTNLSDVIRGDELVNALAKVRSFIPADRVKDIELKANQICIDLSPWMSNEDTKKNLELIKTALGESRLISFNYADHKGSKTVRTAEPYQLVLKSSHWYVQAYCLIRNDFRLFKLSRISGLKIRKDTFIPREYQTPQLNITDITVDEQIKIKIRIHKSIMDRVLDFCSYEHFLSDGDEYYIVDFPFIENDFNYNFLIGLGDKCECLEPAHVRSQIKLRIQNIVRMYED